jgi:hypothetical protein
MVPTLCRTAIVTSPYGFPGLTECTGASLRPVPTDPFTVATMARLVRVTQGERFITLREKGLRENIMWVWRPKSLAIPETFPAYGTSNWTNVSASINFNTRITERYQQNHKL